MGSTNDGRRHGVALAVGAMLWIVAPVEAIGAMALFDAYEIQPDRQFSLPALAPVGFQPATAFDVLADGRIVAVATQDSDGIPRNFTAGTAKLYVESAVGSRDFQLVGDLPLAPVAPTIAWPDFGASFVSVSPSGSRVAVGNNNGRIGIFSTAGLAGGGPVPSVVWHLVDHFDADWLDDSLLMLSNTSGVVAFDSFSSTSDLVVDGISASSGITLDTDGNLYTGQGFGASVGEVRKFQFDDWQDARTSGPLSFGSGAVVTTFSSASSLEFDGEDNLLIGGGVAFGAPFSESNSFAVYRPTDAAQREFDPNTQQNEIGNFYVLRHNHVTGEIYVNEPESLNSSLLIDNTPVYVIAPHSLEAGDTDQNYQFDQYDLIAALDAGKYLLNDGTATWAEGDFNGAVGGFPGNPPTGDGNFNQFDLIDAILTGNYLAGDYRELAAGGDAVSLVSSSVETRTEAVQVSIIYDAATGELRVDAGESGALAAINIASAAGIFTQASAEGLSGLFDIDADDVIFKADLANSFDNVSLGQVARPGLARDFLLGDLTVAGALEVGVELSGFELVYLESHQVVPEPSTLLLVVMLAWLVTVAPVVGRRRGRSFV